MTRPRDPLNVNRKEPPVVSDNNEAADLAGFRAQREALKQEGRRQKACDNDTAYVPDYGREIPPWLNPDVADMVNRVTTCYVGLTQRIVGFQDEIAASVNAGTLDPSARTGLVEHYRHLQQAVGAATTDTLTWHPGGTLETVHRLADHAKYVYAVGARDIAALQYCLSELAGTGRLDPEVHHSLQWDYCLPMWETLYHGTLCAVHDERTWDGGWGWSDNTYSDGRQVMIQARVKNWQELERGWPYNENMCGDGPINEHREERSAKSHRFTSQGMATTTTTRRSRSTSRH